MGQITFLFGIHNHQPVGNFDWVFKDAMDLCYGPFLKVLKNHPGVRVSLHHTGPLLEWIEEHRADYFESLRQLCERGQVELMGGAFYEPLISTLPERDALGQIRMMTKYLQDKFGRTPRGMWLAERVWEPQLASIVKEAGMEYTLLDDTHFYYAGLHDDDMFGYYVTEDKGQTLKIFPINKHLRYLIPFNTPEKAIECLGNVAVDHEGRGVTLGDDGEKFGLWPDTHKWVFEDGYLDRLFGLLESNAGWIKMLTFSEFIDRFSPMGRIYLPTASYEEMMEWSLPAASQKLYHRAAEDLKSNGQYERFRPYLRGGFWRNFFSKYPESNLMHKKMIYVSGLVDQMKERSRQKEAAQRNLWMGQCNCPYWHGLFGGLYLNYLRHANYSHLIGAETAALDEIQHPGAVRVEELDYNCDGKKEVIVATKDLGLFIQPSYGGSIAELDYRPKSFNLTNVLSRREESYHEKIAENQAVHAQADQPQTIHELTAVKEEGLDRLLHYDWYTRYTLLDHFLKPGTTFDEFYRCRYREEGDFVNQSYETAYKTKNTGRLDLVLTRNGHVFREGSRALPLRLEKTLSVQAAQPASFECRYDVVMGDDDAHELDVCFGIEWNLTLLAGQDKKRYYRFNGKSSPKPLMGAKGEVLSCETVELVNEEDGFSVKIAIKPGATAWYFPLETISQSEGGVERTYQGSCLLTLWQWRLAPGEPKTVDICFSVQG